MKDFRQHHWNDDLAGDWQQLLALAVREDVDSLYDWTTVALVPSDVQGSATVVARQPGILAGLPAAAMTAHEYDPHLQWSPHVADGTSVQPGDAVATLCGNARNLLTAERILLNVLSRLSGVATLTSQYVAAVQGTAARIYDTRKTTPGWRRLEKDAVRMGGGHNHRTGLYDAVLIKDNHLALGAQTATLDRYSPAEAVRRVQEFLDRLLPAERREEFLIEVEVDHLEQLRSVLPEQPDIVLLDNMSTDQLVEAVALRDASAPNIQLEASGGISLETVGQVARTGIDRISVGALTHSSPALDLALDWSSPGA